MEGGAIRMSSSRAPTEVVILMHVSGAAGYPKQDGN